MVNIVANFFFYYPKRITTIFIIFDFSVKLNIWSIDVTSLQNEKHYMHASEDKNGGKGKLGAGPGEGALAALMNLIFS